MLFFIFIATKLDTTKFEDKWLSIDKFHHFFYSISITTITYHITNCKIGMKKAKIISLSTGISLGLFKEIYDKYKKKKFSYKDLFFDFLGTGLSPIFW